MISIPLILIIILGILAALIVFKIAKSIIKAIMTGIIIIIIILGILGTIIYFDVSSVKKSFEGEKIFAITNNNTIISTAKITSSELDLQTILGNGLFEGTNKEENKMIQNLLEEKNQETKSFIFSADYEYIKPKENIEIANIEYTEEEIRKTLFEEESEEIKTTITTILIINKIKKLNIKELATSIKEKTVKIKPTLISTTILTATPDTLINKIKLS
ncbi:hypothetical protein K9L67_03215 [Candidatus Woesearchaeota archaeon]|nr:hypothetical protein [Candidatus Woesearchaeota archaeon]MCF7901211.1 hypothetical protein [Candidatus Woesearchaeota archaeon]MCF8013694.1 hypothetical protein [Candidatus Woesearchaeota archaeon]